jgi:hypothetical protein
MTVKNGRITNELMLKRNWLVEYPDIEAEQA